MMKKEKKSISSATHGASTSKRGWFNNMKTVYKVARTNYPWIGWVMLALVIIPTIIFIFVGIFTHNGVFSAIIWVLFGFMLGLLLATILMTRLATKAMYQQLDNKLGAVYAVLGQLKKGWSIEQEPISTNSKHDLIYRIVGRPGIVLISEGAAGRVNRMLADEERKCRRVAHSTPIHRIQVGHGTQQIRINRLIKTINKLPKKISKQEVPVIAQRLSSLHAKGMGMPKGIDPQKARINRRMLRGK